jgi:hypothetical protein
MSRKLVFKDDDLSKKRFEYLFHGLIILGNQNTQKGLSVLNREISLLDKFEQISEPCNCGKLIPGSKEPDRELLKETTSQIEIDDSEFDLLYDYVSKVPWSIGSSSRDALKTLDWLKNPTNDSKTS